MKTLLINLGLVSKNHHQRNTLKKLKPGLGKGISPTVSRPEAMKMSKCGISLKSPLTMLGAVVITLGSLMARHRQWPERL